MLVLVWTHSQHTRLGFDLVSIKVILTTTLLSSNNDCFSLAVPDSGLSPAAVGGICAAVLLLVVLAVAFAKRKGEN